MTTIQLSVDIARPVRTVYNQWTQFESFPHFMAGVDRVVQKGDRRARWYTSIGGIRREFDTEIIEQHPDERIAWTTLGEPDHSGVVTFHRLDENRTRVHLEMDFEPHSLPEKVGTATGIVQHRIKEDLNRFRDFIEHHETETGSWRGNIARPDQTDLGAKPPDATE